MAVKEIRTNINIEEPLLSTFKELYPQHGSIKWFVNECFRKFVELHSFDVNNVIDQTVRDTLEEGVLDESQSQSEEMES